MLEHLLRLRLCVCLARQAPGERTCRHRNDQHDAHPKGDRRHLEPGVVVARRSVQLAHDVEGGHGRPHRDGADHLRRQCRFQDGDDQQRPRRGRPVEAEQPHERGDDHRVAHQADEHHLTTPARIAVADCQRHQEVEPDHDAGQQQPRREHVERRDAARRWLVQPELREREDGAHPPDALHESERVGVGLLACAACCSHRSSCETAHGHGDRST